MSEAACRFVVTIAIPIAIDVTMDVVVAAWFAVGVGVRVGIALLVVMTDSIQWQGKQLFLTISYSDVWHGTGTPIGDCCANRLLTINHCHPRLRPKCCLITNSRLDYETGDFPISPT